MILSGSKQGASNMIDKSQLLRAAWASYRLARPAFFAAGDSITYRVFLRGLFVKMLRQAWADANVEAARRPAEETAQALVTAQHRALVEKLAAMSPGQRSLRISQLRDELTVLDYAPLGVRTANRRRALSVELAAFAV
jgi:hypothetical protein